MPEPFSLSAYLSEKRSAVEKALADIFREPGGPASRIREAMSYSLFAGGKRLRPILCIAAAEAVGGTQSQAMPAACALELIHTYSLIHDDLPGMDDDDLRRGLSTNHKVFGIGAAILAGDGLLTEAFRLLAEKGLSMPDSAPAFIRAMAIIAEAAGYLGMVGGQMADLDAEGKVVSLETLSFIHTHKTADLIAASVKAGAVLANADKPAFDSLGDYGINIGLAFQIRDDLLDVEGDANAMGKSTGSDNKRGKATYPALLGLDRSKEIQRNLVEKALKSIAAFDYRAQPLRAIAAYIIERKS
ncbi:MAG: polyprenyl synthetase [Deltaproteobacteria bacterium CG17_big_fil_post_rev_8_21_14_2_50_51_6]|nr:MAG: polyprenyl synthetase [Deltaproteobacteria bacterium CG17_big_fil_post_rev_8_21_14_2_50_51_6]